MVGILIATYGDIGHSLLSTAVDLVGEPAAMATTITLGDHQDRATAWDGLVSALESVDSGSGVLLMVDMFGSTSSTLALGLLADRHVEVLTGVNLAMVLRALLIQDLVQCHFPGPRLFHRFRGLKSQSTLLCRVCLCLKFRHLTSLKDEFTSEPIGTSAYWIPASLCTTDGTR